MSGIAGIIHFDGKPVEPGLIEKMTGAMAHRGPDGINHWVRGSVALGQCMLRTTPESLVEHQPLTNEDESLVLVMDGRVDNWEELRRELLGRCAVLRTRADAELVLRAYEIWGRDCLVHIDGDFALVIWDTRRREAFCARDRMGNKPFNYHWNGKTFVFASELHAILALPWVSEILNEGMVAEFLAAEWYSRDETFWQDILRLAAAHRMVVDVTGSYLEQYWEPDLWATLPYTTDEEYIDHYRELFADIVRRLSRSHEPVAYEVSGGLDSPAIFCMAEHLRRTDKLPAPSIKGYTLAFTDDIAPGELAYARMVGNYLCIRLHEIPPSFKSLSWYEERARTEREFPGFPNGPTHIGIHQQAVAHGCRILLTGVGGDEWLEGCRAYYAEELVQRRWHELLSCFKSDATAFGARQAMASIMRNGFFAILPHSIQMALRRTVHVMRRSTTRDFYWLAPKLRELIKSRRESSLPLQYSQSVRSQGQARLLNALYLAFRSWGMESLERMGSHSGIEIRHPFRNSQFVQYAFSTPERLRLQGDRTKYIHVCALQELMPQLVLARKEKGNITIIFHNYLRKMELQYTELLFKSRSAWLTLDGMNLLYQAYLDDSDGYAKWVLWGLFGCNQVCP